MLKKAKHDMGRPRIALVGPSFSGKTVWALGIATTWGCKKIGLIDGSLEGDSTMYAKGGKRKGGFEFDFLVEKVREMGGKGVDPADDENLFSPMRFKKAIRGVREAGCDALIVDDATNEWTGEGGTLEIKDRAEATSKNSGWRTATPLHNQFMRAMLVYPGLVIGTYRSKDKLKIYTDEEGGRTKYEMLPHEPICRPGTKFEWKIWAHVYDDHVVELVKVKGNGGEEFLGEYEEPGELVRDLKKYFGGK